MHGLQERTQLVLQTPVGRETRRKASKAQEKLDCTGGGDHALAREQIPQRREEESGVAGRESEEISPRQTCVTMSVKVQELD